MSIKDLIVAMVCAILALFIPYHKFKDWWVRFKQFREVRRTGLKAIFPRTHPSARHQLSQMLREAKSGDKVMILGRTHRGLLEDNGKQIGDAIDRGASVQFLLLDSGALEKPTAGRQIDLRSLGIRDADRTLAQDIGYAEAKLSALQQECRDRGWKGSLLVYRTTVLLQNSAVILEPGSDAKPIRILYDFSFGTEISTKWVHYYRVSKTASVRFANQLCTFYASMFGQESSAFAYDLSYRFSSSGNALRELENIASERAAAIVTANREAETVRENALVRILPAASSVFRSLHQNHAPVPTPLSVQVELTNACTTSCEHCSRWNRSDLPEMSTKLALQLMTDLHAMNVGTVTLSGGEPTVHSAFAEILRHAASQNISVGVLSNGVGLSDETVSVIHDHASWLRLSIDGSSPEVYNRVRKSLLRKQDAFSQAKSTIRRLTDLNKRAFKCRLAICYTIQSQNADDVADMIRWVRSLGIPDSDKCLTFKFAHGATGIATKNFLCSEKQIRHLYEEVFSQPEFRNAANVEYLRWYLKNQSTIGDMAAGRPTQGLYSEQQTRCFTPNLFSLIDPRGDVYPCCFLFEDNGDYSQDVETLRKSHAIGNIANTPFRDLWLGNEYQKVRDELVVIEPSGKYAACGNCTRHCNHNRSLTRLYAEYQGLRRVGGDADSVMSRLVDSDKGESVWL